MRPFFPFYGSKWNIARYYPAPHHAHVVEPFAGSAGYSTFHGVRRVSLVDADPIIVGVWDYLIRASSADIEALPLLPMIGDSTDNYALPQEAKWLIGFWLNRGSASPKKSRTAFSARADKAQLNWGARAKERIISQLDDIRGWSIRHGSYEDAATAQPTTYFVDPPYGDKGKFYRVRMTPCRKLGAWCEGLDGQVIVCEGAGADWLPFKPLGNFKTTKGRALEVMWSNHEAICG